MPSKTPDTIRALAASKNAPAILFFDGICNLCNGFVDWVIRNETAHRLQFASLQGATAKATLSATDIQSLETLIVLTEGKRLIRSEAVIFILQKVGGVYVLLAGILKLIPRFLRDAGYRWVAKNRYRWFGKKNSCRLPTPEEKNLLLP